MTSIRVNRPIPGPALLCASLLLAACTSGPQIRTNISPSVQFENYKTYGFVSDPGTNRAGYSTPITGYFKESIQREMDARGYRYQDASPDLLINFNANARENVDVKSRPAVGYGTSVGYYGYRRGLYMAPMYVGTEVETVRYKMGTANVDVVDASKKELVWEGIGEGRLSNKTMKDPRAAINSAIKDMFVRFPGRIAAQSSP